MAWTFRRSVNLGPFRINLSKRGAGLSVGARGFRVGRDAQGRDYTQMSVPGTGIYNRQYQKNPSQPGQVSAPSKYFIVLAVIAVLFWALSRLILH